MATTLICHGAWSAGWAWKKLRPLLQAAGHEVFTPTYTGLGERAHLAHPLVDLETHVHDILAVIEAEGLRDILLVGHSYGGMVATGVADRVPQLIRHLCYLDAFVPQDGQSLYDLVGGAPVAAPVAGWLVPPNPSAPDTSAADLAWTLPRRRPPAGPLLQPEAPRAHAAPAFPRSYIHCTRKAGPRRLRASSPTASATTRPGASTRMDASHSPNVTAPEALAALLLGLG